MPHGLVRWMQVARAIEADLATYGEAEVLPSESQLCAEFDVSRGTARRAYADLIDRGLVRVVQGVGYFVAPARLFCPHCGGAL